MLGDTALKFPTKAATPLLILKLMFCQAPLFVLSACHSGLSVDHQKKNRDQLPPLIYEPGSEINRIEVVSESDDSEAFNYPLILADPLLVCRDIKFYNGKGELIEGQRDCGLDWNDPHLKPDNLRLGVTIAGVEGNGLSPSDINELVSENIREGVDIAGIVGSFGARPANCTADGDTQCVSTAEFIPVVPAGLAEKMIATASIAGVVGQISLPPEGRVLSGTSFGRGGSASIGSLILPAEAVVLSGTADYGEPGAERTPGYVPDFPDAADVRAIDTVGGAPGSLSNCASDGELDCVATATFRAADMTVASAGNIRSGVSIAGQAGDYPSSTHRLPLASATADLDEATFNAKIKSSASFEFWSSDGTYHTATGDADLQARNIRKDVSLFGATGTAYTRPCLHDDEQTCNDDEACHWSGGLCRLDPWNIRAGVSIEGTGGNIKYNCRNRINSSIYNSDGMPPGNGGATDGTDLDWWDTISQHNDWDTTPSEQPDTWSSEQYCSRELWADITADGACDSAGDDCMMKDLVTNLIWSESYPVSGVDKAATNLNWSNAIAHCANLSFGGRSDWRLPTQMELHQAFAHGISELGYRSGTTRPGGNTLANNSAFLAVTAAYWTATSNALNTAEAHNLHLSWGFSNILAKTNSTFTVVCVTDWVEDD